MAINEHQSDFELVEKLQSGDLDAFDQIFKRFGDKLFGFALKYLKSKEETEELVQDVFLKIWENRKNLKKESSLKSYLFTIAYHNICRVFKKKQIYLKFLEENKSIANSTFNLEDQIEYKGVLEQIDLLIERLPEKQRAIFIKSYKEGKSTKEIAKEVNLAPGTVDNHISAALKFLRNQISGENFALLLFFIVFVQ
jgi:RNA polymerase sigma-70 factor (ECF subfamily)